MNCFAYLGSELIPICAKGSRLLPPFLIFLPLTFPPLDSCRRQHVGVYMIWRAALTEKSIPRLFVSDKVLASRTKKPKNVINRLRGGFEQLLRFIHFVADPNALTLADRLVGGKKM